MNPGTHNFFSKLNGVRNASGHIIKQYGSTVPTDGTAGYAVGCEFHHTDGSGIDDMLYINVGTTASCNFDSVTSDASLLGDLTGNILADDDAVIVTSGATVAASSIAVGSIVVDDITVDAKTISMIGSTGDTADIVVGTNGTLTITTVDADAAAANISLVADGTIGLDAAGNIAIDADGGTIIFLDNGVSLGTVTSAGFTGAVVATALTATGLVTPTHLSTAMADAIPKIGTLTPTDLASNNTGTVTGAVQDATGTTLAGYHLITAWTSATANAVPEAVAGFGITSGEGLEMVELLAEGAYLIQTKSDGTFSFDVKLSAPGSTFVNVAIGGLKSSVECAVTAGE